MEGECRYHKDVAAQKMRWICINCDRQLLCPQCIVEPRHANHKIVEASTLLVERIQSSNKLLLKVDSDLASLNNKIEAETTNKQLLEDCLAAFRESIITLINTEYIAPILNMQDSVIHDLLKNRDLLRARYAKLLLKVQTARQANLDKLKREDYSRIDLPPVEEVNDLEYAAIERKKDESLQVELNIEKLVDLKEPLERIQKLLQAPDKSTVMKGLHQNGASVLVRSDDKRLKMFWADTGASKIQAVQDTSYFNEGYFCIRVHDSMYILAERRGFYELPIKALGRPTRKADVLVSRQDYKMVSIQDSYIYLLGGQQENKALAQCEKYNIAHNSWLSIPPLNEARYQHSAFCFNQLVYCFGGNAQDRVTLSSMERLDVFEEAAGWACINVLFELASPSLAQVFNPGALQITPHDCLLFGGRDFQQRKKSCFVFEHYQHRFRAIPQTLNIEDSFISLPILYQANLFALGVNENVHIFRTYKKTWTHCPYSK